MAIKLNIPVLEDNPIFMAETRPHKIQQSLLDLAARSRDELATYLHEELQTLNRQKVSASTRLEALESYRPFLIDTARYLSASYINATLPLHDDAKTAATAVESLWLELGYGYKLALIDLQNQLIKLGKDKSSALAIQRAMHAISAHALLHYQTYVTPPSHIWSDLHQLYFCAVQLGIHTDQIETKKAAFEPPTLTNIQDTYKHALLIALAGPEQLTQQDIGLVYEYLKHHIRIPSISTIAPLRSTSGVFVISLDSDAPPKAFSKQSHKPNPISDILLKTINLVSAIHKDLKALQTNRLPENGSIPANANRYDYIELLTHLIKNWGIHPKRIYQRSLNNGDISLLAGIPTLHGACSKNAATPAEQSAFPDVLHMESTHWKILNISPTGMAVRRTHTAEKNISLGAVVGIKSANEAHWAVGLVRWANCGTRDRLDIGIQLIAPSAQAAIAHTKNGSRHELILLLPEIKATSQTATIMAPIDTYQPARQLVVSLNNKIHTIMLTKLLERTHTVERMQYSVLD